MDKLYSHFLRSVVFLTLATFVISFLPAASLADAVDWQLGFQEPASPVMEKLVSLHSLLLYIIIAVCVFVLGLLIYVAIRFNEKANPTPRKFTHNTTIEIIWTVVPILILIAIAIPSFRLIYYMDKAPSYYDSVVVEDGITKLDGTANEEAVVKLDGQIVQDGVFVKDGKLQISGMLTVNDERIYDELTLKIVGHQWFWEYVYPEYNNKTLESIMVPLDEIDPKTQVRLLEVDNRVLVPVDTNIRILVTASDVIHAWALPQMGVKVDAVPGRTNERWFRATKKGTYRGQCSELCGKDHAYMPIVVDVVSKEAFDKWVAGSESTSVTIDAQPVMDPWVINTEKE